MMTSEQVHVFQKELSTCPDVFGVFIRCEGEENLDTLWATKHAADLRAAEHNNMKGNKNYYYGKAFVRCIKLRSEEIAVKYLQQENLK